MMRNKDYKEFEQGFEKLKDNSWYWEMDNEFKHKYRMLFDFDKSTRDTQEYMLAIVRYMLDVNERIFGRKEASND